MPAKRSGSKGWRAWAAGWRRLRAAQVALVVGVLAVVGLLYVNLASSERKVERPIPHRYATTDSQFVRTMGSLLGPGFVGGRNPNFFMRYKSVCRVIARKRAARVTLRFARTSAWRMTSCSSCSSGQLSP